MTRVYCYEGWIRELFSAADYRFTPGDGEKIAEMAVDHTNDQLKDSIRSMLGISVLDVLSNDIIRNLKKMNKAGKQSVSADEIELSIHSFSTLSISAANSLVPSLSVIALSGTLAALFTVFISVGLASCLCRVLLSCSLRVAIRVVLPSSSIPFPPLYFTSL